MAQPSCTPSLRWPGVEDEDDDEDENEAISSVSANQKRTQIQTGCPLFMTLDGSAQESFEHFFF